MNPYHLPRQPASPVQKLLTFVVGAALLVVGLMFSAVVVVVGVVIGLLVWGYLWWKTRDLRRAMREAQQTAQQSAQQSGFYRQPRGQDGDIIEGEAVVVEEVRTTGRGDGADDTRR